MALKGISSRADAADRAGNAEEDLVLEADAICDSRIQERLSDIERALDALGYAAAADPATRTVLMAPKAESAPDPQALWRLITAAPVASFTDDELLDDHFLLTALQRVFAE